MTRKMYLIAISVLGFAHVGFAAAAGSSHPDNSESGTVYHGPEYKRADGKFARVDTWNASTSVSNSAAPSPDPNWEFVGGDSGWQLRQPHYSLRGDRIDDNDDGKKDSRASQLASDGASPLGRK